MPFVVLLTDRDPSDALPALADLRVDLKTDPLASPSIEHVAGLSPDVVIVDASENPGQGFAICRELGSRPLRAPTIALVERDQLARFPWEEVAEDFLYPGAPENEIDTRLRMLVRRHGRAQAHVIRLGALSIDTDTFRVTMSGRTLDLTFKEFELLRFLAQHRSRAFTRPSLLREVWGYDFYGGTRTVDVHVRRLRVKLGPEHEHLIETVRGVGYRAAAPDD